MSKTSQSADDFFRVAKQIAAVVRQAAILLRRPVESISFGQNPTTDLDVEVSDFLARNLKSIRPAPVFSEEDVARQRPVQRETWIIDPIDGTLNLLAGSPDVAISVALVNGNLDTIAGVVFLPFFDEMYIAARGIGSFLGDSRIVARQPTTSILAYGLPGEAIQAYSRMAPVLDSALSHGLVLRQSGSAALDVCRVAKGTWKGFCQRGLFIWDIAAADLIAREAGCASRLRLGGDQVSCDYLVGHSDGVLQSLTQDIGWED